MAIKLHASIAVHPGRWLKAEVIEHYAMSVTRVAQHLGFTRPAMSNLLNGKAALSPEMAIRFEAGFGIPAATMLRMQRRTTWRRPSCARTRSRWSACPRRLEGLAGRARIRGASCRPALSKFGATSPRLTAIADLSTLSPQSRIC